MVNRLGRDKGQVFRALASLKKEELVQWSGGHNRPVLVCPKGKEALRKKVLEPARKALELLESKAKVEPLTNSSKEIGVVNSSFAKKASFIEKFLEGVKKGARKDLEVVSNLLNADTFEGLVEELLETVEYEVNKALDGIELARMNRRP